MTRLTLDTLVKHLGGPNGVAEQLGVSRRRLWFWRSRRASVPAEYIARLAELARAGGAELDLESCAKRREPC